MSKDSKMLKFKGKRSPMQNAIAALFLVFVTWFFMSALPTQWFAAHVNYDRGLGEPLFEMGGHPVYFPLDWVGWGWRLADYEPIRPAVHNMVWLGAFGLVVAILSAVAYVLILGGGNEGMDELHGSAHWADAGEVDSTGFMPSKTREVEGAMIGSVMLDKRNQVVHPLHRDYKRRYRKRYDGPFYNRRVMRNKDGVPLVELTKAVSSVQYLRDDNPAHILAFAPTRSGKGVGLVLPTLYTWRHSVLVNDIKGENWALSAGFRKQAGQRVIKFEPACMDGSGAKWNALDEIRTFTKMDVQDAQTIMNMVCDPKGEGLDDHWAKTSWEFLTGLALHLVYEGRTPTLAGMAMYLGDPRWEEEKQMYSTMLSFIHDPEMKAGWTDPDGHPTGIHPAVANAAKTMLNKEDKERTSVLSTAKSFLSLYLDPIVAENTSSSDFLVKDLMNSDTPVSCYFVVQPTDLDRMVSLSRLFYALVIRRNAADMHYSGGASKGSYKHRLLMLIDELPALKKLTVLQEGLGYIAGYGIKCFLICQDIIQLEDAYGDKQTILAGCHVRIAYAPNTSETADKLAAMTGKTTIIEERRSSSFKKLGFDTGNVSVSLDKTERELFTPAEFLSLSPEDMVIFVAGTAPIYGRKIKYYEDAVMSVRSKIVAPEKSDIVRAKLVVVPPTAKDVAEQTNRAEWAQNLNKAAEGKSRSTTSAPGTAPAVDTAETPKPEKQSAYAKGQSEVSDEDQAAILHMVKEQGLEARMAQLNVFEEAA